MKILCLDYGRRFIGVAITDADGVMALRFGNIDRQQENWLEKINEIVKIEKIEKILVGVPKGLSGKVTSQEKEARQTINELRRRFGQIEIEAVNEVFTTKEAARRIRAEGGNLAEEHAEAARIMLEDYIKMTKSQ